MLDMDPDNARLLNHEIYRKPDARVRDHRYDDLIDACVATLQVNETLRTPRSRS
jgi:hypothetical protein